MLSCVLWGGERCGGLQKLFRSKSDPRIPLKRSTFSTGCGIGLLDRKMGIEKALFRPRKNARFGLRSEIALFDPPIRLHKIELALSWPQTDYYADPIPSFRFWSGRKINLVGAKSKQASCAEMMLSLIHI